MFKHGNRLVALAALGAMSFTTFGGALLQPAQASSNGRRNTTIALGAVTGAALLKHKTGLAVVGALGTAYAYKRYHDSKHHTVRHSSLTRSQRRERWYRERYGANWRSHYNAG